MAEPLSDQEVQELIRIADSGVKERRGHWYTLGIPINHHYELREQLDAIEKLGLSQNQLALGYLRELNKKSESERYDGSACYTYTFYPNAKGELAENLRGEQCQFDGYGDIYKSPSPYVADTIHKSLSRLEASLKENKS